MAQRILIADDTAAIRDVLREALVDEGYDVSEAATGEEVLVVEEETIERYSRRLKQAEEAGEIAIKIELEDLVVGETRHRDDIRRILADWRA